MIKEMMIRGMDRVMLSCEEATYLMTKSEYTPLTCLKRMQLKMHLAGCELCRRFQLQSDFINKQLAQLESLPPTQSSHKLPQEKKAALQALLQDLY